jgi:hypothetical protein
MEDDEKNEHCVLAIEISAEMLVHLDERLAKTSLRIQSVDLIITVMGAQQPAIRFWRDTSNRWAPDAEYRVCTDGVPSLRAPWTYYIQGQFTWYPTLRDAWYSLLTPTYLAQAESDWSRVADRFTSMLQQGRYLMVWDEFLDTELAMGHFHDDRFVEILCGYPRRFQHLVERA